MALAYVSILPQNRQWEGIRKKQRVFYQRKALIMPVIIILTALLKYGSQRKKFMRIWVRKPRKAFFALGRREHFSGPIYARPFHVRYASQEGASVEISSLY